MTIKEFYDEIGGDYDGVMNRLRKEERIQKFVLAFLGDTSYELIQNSLKEKNYPEAFRGAHTIKGLCQNLGFSRLYVSSNALTEALRDEKNVAEADSLMEAMTVDYNETVEAIRKLQ